MVIYYLQGIAEKISLLILDWKVNYLLRNGQTEVNLTAKEKKREKNKWITRLNQRIQRVMLYIKKVNYVTTCFF